MQTIFVKKRDNIKHLLNRHTTAYSGIPVNSYVTGYGNDLLIPAHWLTNTATGSNITPAKIYSKLLNKLKAINASPKFKFA